MGATSSGDRQLGVAARLRVGVDEACTASMRRGMVSAANMSPVPEKKRGSCGVSMRKRRGLWSEVAVEPMMVRVSMSSRLISGAGGAAGVEVVGQVEGCEVAASRDCGSVGVCEPVPAWEVGRVGEREESVWLSRVKRREVMMT